MRMSLKRGTCATRSHRWQARLEKDHEADVFKTRVSTTSNQRLPLFQSTSRSSPMKLALLSLVFSGLSAPVVLGFSFKTVRPPSLNSSEYRMVSVLGVLLTCQQASQSTTASSYTQTQPYWTFSARFSS
jgi:hypothetical protein